MSLIVHMIRHCPHILIQDIYTNSVCDIAVCCSCTLESTSSCTTVLVVSRTRTVCKSFSSSRPFSISCHNMLMMFPAAACHEHTNILNIYIDLYQILAFDHLSASTHTYVVVVLVQLKRQYQSC